MNDMQVVMRLLVASSLNFTPVTTIERLGLWKANKLQL